LAKLARNFVSECSLTNLRNDHEGNAKSVLSIISLDIREGDRCLVRINGTDEQFGYTTLRDFAEHVLPTCDVPLAKSFPPTPSLLPRILQHVAVKCYSGSTASPGVGRGKVVLLNSVSLPHAAVSRNGTDPMKNCSASSAHLRTCVSTFERNWPFQFANTEDVLQAELALLDDILFAKRLAHEIKNEKSAAQAVLETGNSFRTCCVILIVSTFGNVQQTLRRSAAHLLSEICGKDLPKTVITLHEPSVVVADTLAPRQFLRLDRHFLKGIVLEYAGANSHALILARSYGVPAIMGIKPHKVPAFRQGRKL
jgi:fructose-specific PTS system IIA-like component